MVSEKGRSFLCRERKWEELAGLGGQDAGARLGTSLRILRPGVEWAASGNPVEGRSPPARGTTRAIVRLEGRDDSVPCLRDLRAVGFVGREFGGEPSFSGQEL